MTTRSTAIPLSRRADPYRDTDVIDARAPRFNQTVIALASTLAVATGWWPILALFAAQLAIGLRFGRRWCVTCLAYFELIQPRFGEGPIEDSRPPRFANLVGTIVLGAASLAYVAGFVALGAALGILVAVLAALAALTGFCAGCEMYKLGARLWGIRSHLLERIDPGDVAGIADRTVIEFTHPLCTDCHELEKRLATEGERVIGVDVSRRSDLARKYGIAAVPVAVRVDARGQVVERIAG
ncbi:MAG: DUF4395 family protein [Candidatus Limnocylindria bacterium]